MSTVELKNKIVERLETIEEPQFLTEILNFIDVETNKDSDVFIIPEEYKADLEVSFEQKKAGQTLSNEVVKQRVKAYSFR